MKTIPLSLTWVLLPLLLVTCSPLRAEALGTGDPFPAFQANDQHEKPFPMPKDTHYVAVTFAMASGKKANRFFAEKGADYLPANNAVFLSNIFGMPAVARVFALPKMQKYPHRIMLADQEGLLDDFPQEKGMVTIFTLNADGTIEAIRFWDPESGTEPF